MSSRKGCATPESGRQIVVLTGMVIVWLIGVAFAAGRSQPSPQAASQPSAQMSDEVFKNIQVLKGIPVDDFLGSMGIMSAALGFCCSECHTGAGTDTVKWEVDTPRKRTARKMVEMVTGINRDNFGGRQVVTCWTCHRGRDRPLVTPAMDTVYGPAAVEMDDILGPASGEPAPDVIIDKYLQALGGSQRLAGVTSFAATGTSVGFGGFGGGGQVEIYAQAPDQRATRIHFADPERGDVNRTFDGRAGWLATPLTVVREYPLRGGELDGAKLEAELSFPAQIKQVLGNLRVTAPTTINDRDVQVVQGTGSRGLVATLYFDKESGLLVRMVRLGPSPIGRVPTQIDYSDYRDVGGVKMPFRWTVEWLDGRDAFELKEVKLNVPIDPAKFGKPPAAARR
jgi:photosynthetic reaction center cytochrome c subunit